ncbi:hypothetical protein CANARDRAFT_29820 [[Candida] arabinofermentans NRRL YB-2248]|uniref:Calcium-channel protein CCH1 n=1 Tax=[Candida] arabinofermentans NRRL YB-2248 TaxID=983967 RepID=A0A1E4SVQ6_9ASCO|nr:hypothetical protein CANARDRAFT_29820 [[Candida] arabinofermentans NRRL YB-2248]
MPRSGPENPFDDTNAYNDTASSFQADPFADPIGSRIRTNPPSPTTHKTKTSYFDRTSLRNDSFKKALPRSLSSKILSFISRKLSTDTVDQSFTSPNIDYSLLDTCITETLKPDSKWRTEFTKESDIRLEATLNKDNQLDLGIARILSHDDDNVDRIPLQDLAPTLQRTTYTRIDNPSLPPLPKSKSEQKNDSILNTSKYNPLDAQQVPQPLEKRISDYKFKYLSQNLQEIADNVSGTDRELKSLVGNSLFIFNSSNPFRKFCYSICRSAIFSNILFFIILIETVLLSYQMWAPEKTGYWTTKRYSWIDYALIITNSLYTLGGIIKIISLGLIIDKEFQLRDDDGNIQYFNLFSYFKDKDRSETSPDEYATTYLKSPGHVLDIIGIISFVISTILGFSGAELNSHFFLFRSLMCLKVLRICNSTAGSRTIQRAINKSLPVLSKISLILLGLMIWFSVISVQAFAESMRKKCVWFGDDTYIETSQLCGGYLDYASSDSQTMIVKPPAIGEYYLHHHSFNESYFESILKNRSAIVESTISPKGFTCPLNSVCLYGSNPNNNTLSFDNFWNSLEIIFVILSSNTFTDLMYQLMDATSVAEGAVFFVFASMVLSIWMTNILVASIVDTMSIVAEEDQDGKIKKNMADEVKGKFGNMNDFLKGRSLTEKIWEGFCSLLIVIDVIVMATNNTSERVLQHIFIFSAIIATILAIDIVIRLFLYRMEFFHYFINDVDFLLAIINLIILIPPIRVDKPYVYGWFSLFQLVRIYRPMIFVPSIRKVWSAVLGNFTDLFHLFAFSLLLIFSISIIYARFFEGIVTDRDDIESNLSTMISLSNVMLSLYIILTSENWTNVVYLTLERATNSGTRLFIFLYLSFWFCFANLLIVNIFLSLITSNLSKTTEVEQKWHQVVNFMLKARRSNTNESEQFAIFDKFYDSLGTKSTMHEPDQSSPFDVDRINDIISNNHSLSSYLKRFKYPLNLYQKVQIRLSYHIRSRFQDFSLIQFYDLFYFEDTSLFHYDGTFESDFAAANEHSTNRRKFFRLHPFYNRTLIVFGPDNKFRNLCQLIVPNFHGKRYGTDKQYHPGTDTLIERKSVWPSTIFEIFITSVTIFMIVITCIMTPLYCMEHKYYKSEWNLPIILDLVFSIIFTIEFMLHAVADGLLFTPSAYLMDKWGLISTITLISMWVDFIVELYGIEGAAFVQGIKAMRALRLLTVSKLTRDTFDSTLISGFQSMITAAVTSITLLIPFAIWGINILSQKLNNCNDSDSDMNSCFGDYIDTSGSINFLAPRAYIRNQFNFDRFDRALSTLFQITSVEGWSTLLYQAMRTSSVGAVPTYHKFSMNGFYIVLFNLVSTLFILNLFLSEIINGYSRKTGVAYLTDYQVGWNGYKNIVKSIEPDVAYEPRYNKFETMLYNFFVEPIMIAKVINVLVYVALASALLYDDTTLGGIYYKRITIIICLLFLLTHHLVIFFYGSKKGGFKRIKSYATIIICIVCIVLGAVNYHDSFSNRYPFKLSQAATDSVQKVLLCFLFAFLPRMSPRLYTFMRFSIMASRQFISLLFIWFVLFLVFAIGLNQTFGTTKLGENSSWNINCRTITSSSLLLFASSFGEGWNTKMSDYFLEKPFCTVSPTGYSDCGGKWQAYLYFISWNILSMYLLMNVFISIVVEAFMIMYHDDPISQKKFDDTVTKFKKVWRTFDLEGSGFISVEKFDNFLNQLEKNRVFSHDEVTFKSTIKSQFKNEVMEKAVSDVPVSGKSYPFQFNVTLMLVVYYNYFSGEKNHLRTFEDYLWRLYLSKFNAMSYDDYGNVIMSNNPDPFASRQTTAGNKVLSGQAAGVAATGTATSGGAADELKFLERIDDSLKEMGLREEVDRIRRGEAGGGGGGDDNDDGRETSPVPPIRTVL